MNTVGSRVREEREKQGIRRTDFAKMVGIGYSTIAELERGGMQTSTKLRSIADALGVSLEWLETGKGQRIPPQQPLAPPSETQPTRALVALGERLAKADQRTRDAVAELLLRYAQDPANGTKLLKAIEALLGDNG